MSSALATGVCISAVEGAALEAALDVLLPIEPDLPYANLAPIAARPGAAIELHRRRWCDRRGRPSVLVAYAADGRPLGALRFEPRDFESSHFGMPMAKIERPLAVADLEVRRTVLARLYRHAFDHLRAAGYAHVAARTSTRDRTSGWTLQELGAFHVDTQVSWLSHLAGAPRAETEPRGPSVEIFEHDAIRSLGSAAWGRLLEWGARAFDCGPLVFDHTLPYDRAREVYAVWTEKVRTGEWADAVIVVRDRGEVVAFNSIQIMHDVSEAAGVRVVGRGLGATLPEYRGLFTAIQCKMMTARPLGASFLENETQVATLGSINVYARLGNRLLRSTSTFHLRLDGQRAR